MSTGGSSFSIPHSYTASTFEVLINEAATIKSVQSDPTKCESRISITGGWIATSTYSVIQMQLEGIN